MCPTKEPLKNFETTKGIHSKRLDDKMIPEITALTVIILILGKYTINVHILV